MKNSILANIIKWLAVAALFTPLIISSRFIFPFVFPKTALFQVLVEIMFFLWLILIARAPEFRPATSKIFWAVSLFLCIVIIASLFGVSFQLSFWSAYERMTGIVTLLHYFAYFLILCSVLRTKKDWLLFFDFFIIVSILLSLFAFGQRLNLKSFVLAGQGRVSATFGNPAYFAAYLLFILFFIAFMFFQRQKKGMKIYYGATFLFTLLIFYWTETRGALLGFAVSVVLFLLALSLWPKDVQEKEFITRFRQRLKKIALVTLIAFVIFASLVYLFRDSNFIKSSVTLSRLTTISLKGMDVQTRLLAWKMALKGFAERPILGWGWENYASVFNKYYDPYIFPTENWFDRAHNIVFDIVISSGIIGFLSYLAIFAAVYWVLWRSFKKKRIDFLNLSLFGILLIGYFGQNFFVFDMLHSYIPFFTLLAFFNWVGKEEKNFQLKAAPKTIGPNIFFIAIIILVFVFTVYQVNIKPALTGYYGIKALEAQKEGLAKVLEGFKKSLSYHTFGRFECRLQIFEMSKNILASYNQMPNKTVADQFINFAFEESEKTVKERSYDTRYLLSIGQLNLMASSVDPQKFNRLERAAEILDLAQRLSPTRQITLFALAEARIKQGRVEEGIKLLEKAVELNPRAGESQWNLTMAYFAVGNLPKAEQKLAEIEKQNPITASQYKKITDFLVMQRNYQQALFYISKAIALEPQNVDFYAGLAEIYANLGEKDKAKEAALKAAELNPAIKDKVDEFIKSLGI